MIGQALLKQVFVSYNWGAEAEQEKSGDQPVVDALQLACEKRGITLQRDKDVIQYRGSISGFMERVSSGSCVVLVLSDGYFHSEYCLQELLGIQQNGELPQRVFPILLDGTPLSDGEYQTRLVKHWKDKAAQLGVARKTTREVLDFDAQIKRQQRYETISREIGSLTAKLADMNLQTQAWHQGSEFDVLLDQIQRQLGKIDGTADAESAANQWRLEVAQHLREVLDDNALAPLKNALSDRLRQDQLDNPHDPAAALCAENLPVEDAIGVYLHGAVLDCNKQGWDQPTTELHKVLGWLVLIGGESLELDAIRDTLRSQDVGVDLQIPWRTPHGVEVVTATLAGKHADLQRCGDQGGPNWINANALPDKGFGAAANLNELKRTLWTHLGHYEQVPKTFSDSDNRRLIKSLKRKIRQRDYQFVAIPLEQGSHPLQSPAARKLLLEQLPGLWPLTLGVGSEQALLLLEEEMDLCDVIQQFLKLVGEPQ